MARWIHVAWFALLLGGCGGPPVGQAVPKANTNKMAIGAAAAATAITLIDPKSAGHKPESEEEEKEKKVKKSGENVSSGALDRLDAKSDDDDPCDPNAKSDDDDAKKEHVDPVPKVVNENREAAEREHREKCREKAESEDSGAAEP